MVELLPDLASITAPSLFTVISITTLPDLLILGGTAKFLATRLPNLKDTPAPEPPPIPVPDPPPEPIPVPPPDPVPLPTTLPVPPPEPLPRVDPVPVWAPEDLNNPLLLTTGIGSFFVSVTGCFLIFSVIVGYKFFSFFCRNKIK